MQTPNRALKHGSENRGGRRPVFRQRYSGGREVSIMEAVARTRYTFAEVESDKLNAANWQKIASASTGRLLVPGGDR